jgi:3-hydroxyacyl-[acyl-carrier-protein] dehydratase
MLYNQEQVLKFLPHRAPFLFVDSIESIELPPGVNQRLVKDANYGELKGATYKGHFLARKDLKIFEGHFPGNPVLPGVIQVEIMAQCSAFVINKYILDVFEPENQIKIALMNVASAKFRAPVIPGMNLEISGECTRARGGILAYDGRIHCDGVLLSEASFMASLSFK